jgi:succinyldiaminopimelate transaminase
VNPQLITQPENPMVRLDAVVARVRAMGRPVYDLGIGDPQEPTPEFIVAALKAAVPAVSQYPRSIGSRELRDAIAGYVERRFKVSLDPEREILPSAGAKEAIFHLPLLLIDPQADRRAVLFPDPGYAIYERGTAFAGGEPHPLLLRDEKGFLPELESLPAALLDRTALFWLCSPQNPTGAVAWRETLAKLAELSSRHGFVVAADECYADVYFDQPPPSMLEVSRSRVLVFHSLSKRSGMTGMRSGFMAGDPELIAALKRFRPSIGTASPDFVQAAATAAWGNDEHAEQRREIFRRKRQILRALMSDLRLRATGEAGLYLWVQVPGDDERYARELAERAGVVVQPGSFLGEGGRGYIRVALSPTVEQCEAAAAAWRRAEVSH